MNSLYKGKSRITYYDLDFHGKVKLSALLRMVHIAADVNAKDLGIGFSVLYPLDISFILQRFGLSVFRMPKYDENIIIRTWPAATVRGTFIRKGDMTDAKGNKLMEWASLWILFNIVERKILKPSALPVEIPALGDMGVVVEPQKISLPNSLGTPFSSYIHTVKYAEVDTNIHMNNSIYGDLIGNVLFSGDTYLDWKQVQINYQAETRLDEQIEVSAYHLDDTQYVVGQAPGRTSFTAKLMP